MTICTSSVRLMSGIQIEIRRPILIWSSFSDHLSFVSFLSTLWLLWSGKDELCLRLDNGQCVMMSALSMAKRREGEKRERARDGESANFITWTMSRTRSTIELMNTIIKCEAIRWVFQAKSFHIDKSSWIDFWSRQTTKEFSVIVLAAFVFRASLSLARSVRVTNHFSWKKHR